MKFLLTFAASDMIGTGMSYEADIDMAVRIVAIALGILWFIWRAREYPCLSGLDTQQENGK